MTHYYGCHEWEEHFSERFPTLSPEEIKKLSLLVYNYVSRYKINVEIDLQNNTIKEFINEKDIEQWKEGWLIKQLEKASETVQSWSKEKQETLRLNR